EGGIARLEATRCLQARFKIGRYTAHGHPVKIRGCKGYFGKRLLAIGIRGDMNFAIGVRHILWPHIEYMSRDLLGLVLDFGHRPRPAARMTAQCRRSRYRTRCRCPDSAPADATAAARPATPDNRQSARLYRARWDSCRYRT